MIVIESVDVVLAFITYLFLAVIVHAVCHSWPVADASPDPLARHGDRWAGMPGSTISSPYQIRDAEVATLPRLGPYEIITPLGAGPSLFQPPPRLPSVWRTFTPSSFRAWFAPCHCAAQFLIRGPDRKVAMPTICTCSCIEHSRRGRSHRAEHRRGQYRYAHSAQTVHH